MAIKILVDASADISIDEAKKLNIKIIPMPVRINEKEYLAGLNLDNETFYYLLTTEKVFPKTSQLTTQVYLEHYNLVKENNDDLIVITLSSGLSGTYQSAVLAKENVKYDNIYVVDSLLASAGIRILVDYAVKLRNENKTALEIYQSLEGIKKRISLYAMVDTLEYLYKGGRLSKKQAVIGDFINLKPILTFQNDGTLMVVEKTIGKTRAKKAIMKLFNENPIDTNYPIYFMYSVHAESTKKLAAKIKEEHGFNYTDNIHEIGPVIGAHVGPGAIGIVYIKK